MQPILVRLGANLAGQGGQGPVYRTASCGVGSRQRCQERTCLWVPNG